MQPKKRATENLKDQGQPKHNKKSKIKEPRNGTGILVYVWMPPGTHAEGIFDGFVVEEGPFQGAKQLSLIHFIGWNAGRREWVDSRNIFESEKQARTAHPDCKSKLNYGPLGRSAYKIRLARLDAFKKKTKPLACATLASDSKPSTSSSKRSTKSNRSASNLPPSTAAVSTASKLATPSSVVAARSKSNAATSFNLPPTAVMPAHKFAATSSGSSNSTGEYSAATPSPAASADSTATNRLRNKVKAIKYKDGNKHERDRIMAEQGCKNLFTLAIRETSDSLCKMGKEVDATNLIQGVYERIQAGMGTEGYMQREINRLSMYATTTDQFHLYNVELNAGKAKPKYYDSVCQKGFSKSGYHEHVSRHHLLSGLKYPCPEPGCKKIYSHAWRIAPHLELAHDWIDKNKDIPHKHQIQILDRKTLMPMEGSDPSKDSQDASYYLEKN